MTEEEAKDKWCPMYRQGIGGSYDNRLGNTQDARCIASKCMMWRWRAKLQHDGTKFDNYIPVRTGRGYCGLAAEPHYD